MNPLLFHIYGPFAVHWYGLMIAIGAGFALWRVRAEFLAQNLMPDKLFSRFVLYTLIAGFIGAKALQIFELFMTGQGINENTSIFGGFSVLGAIAAIAVFFMFFARMHHLKTLRITDICAQWTPLVQAFTRIGCFIAGCCNGCPTSLPWAVTYTHPDSLAMPMHTPVHPTQLYSAAMLLIIWALLQWIGRPSHKIAPGTLTLLYFLCAFTERFVLDFWRADASVAGHALTFMQWVALAGICGVVSVFVILKIYYKIQIENNNKKI